MEGGSVGTLSCVIVCRSNIKLYFPLHLASMGIYLRTLLALMDGLCPTYANNERKNPLKGAEWVDGWMEQRYMGDEGAEGGRGEANERAKRTERSRWSESILFIEQKGCNMETFRVLWGSRLLVTEHRVKVFHCSSMLQAARNVWIRLNSYYDHLHGWLDGWAGAGKWGV